MTLKISEKYIKVSRGDSFYTFISQDRNYYVRVDELEYMQFIVGDEYYSNNWKEI